KESTRPPSRRATEKSARNSARRLVPCTPEALTMRARARPGGPARTRASATLLPSAETPSHVYRWQERRQQSDGGQKRADAVHVLDPLGVRQFAQQGGPDAAHA